MRSGFKASEIQEGRGDFWGGWSSRAEEFLEKNSFRIAVFDGDWGDFSFFSSCGKSIMDLTISHHKTGIIDGLYSLPQLKKLTLEFKNKGCFDFSRLALLEKLQVKFTNREQDQSFLKHTSLRNLRIDNLGDVGEMIKNNHLEYLELVRPRVTDLKLFENFSRLSGVEIHRSRDLRSLDGMPENVRSVHIEFCRKLKSIRRIAGLRNLNIFMLIASWPHRDFPEEIFDCADLKRIVISETPLVVDWERVLSMKNLDLVSFISHDKGPTDDEILSLAKENRREILAIRRQGPVTNPMIVIRLREPEGTMNSDKLLKLIRS